MTALVDHARITGLVGAVASEVVTDQALAERLGISVAEVSARSRGLSRTSAPDGTGPAALAADLSARLLSEARMVPTEIGLIIFATTTPDVTFPGSACYLQAILGVPGVACLDVRSQCVGFLTALDVAAKFVQCGTYARVLVAAADVPSHVVRYDGAAPELAVLTGDGGAVALVESGSGGGEVLSCVTYLDGGRFDEFWCEFPASRHLSGRGVARGERMSRDAFVAGRHYPRIDLDRVRTTALERVPGVLEEALSIAGLDRVDVAVVSHIDPEVEDALSAQIAPRVGDIVRRHSAYGFGSTLPIALADAAGDGRVARGQTVALVTAGAGASWGAAVLRW